MSNWNDFQNSPTFIYYKDFNPEHNIDRFLPDGNTGIVIDFSGEPQYIYDNNTLKKIQACHNVWVSGIRMEPISIPSYLEFGDKT